MSSQQTALIIQAGMNEVFRKFHLLPVPRSHSQNFLTKVSGAQLGVIPALREKTGFGRFFGCKKGLFYKVKMQTKVTKGVPCRINSRRYTFCVPIVHDQRHYSSRLVVAPDRVCPGALA